jgi:hypothetical protein
MAVRMPFQIDIMKKKGIVKLTFSGNSDLEEHKRSRDDAAAICREKGFIRVWVDMTELESFMCG